MLGRFTKLASVLLLVSGGAAGCSDVTAASVIEPLEARSCAPRDVPCFLDALEAAAPDESFGIGVTLEGLNVATTAPAELVIEVATAVGISPGDLNIESGPNQRLRTFEGDEAP